MCDQERPGTPWETGPGLRQLDGASGDPVAARGRQGRRSCEVGRPLWAPEAPASPLTASVPWAQPTAQSPGDCSVPREDKARQAGRSIGRAGGGEGGHVLEDSEALALPLAAHRENGIASRCSEGSGKSRLQPETSLELLEDPSPAARPRPALRPGCPVTGEGLPSAILASRPWVRPSLDLEFPSAAGNAASPCKGHRELRPLQAPALLRGGHSGRQGQGTQGCPRNERLRLRSQELR